MIPVLRPLKDPGIATVWSGLAASTIGEDLFRVAVVWIAAEHESDERLAEEISQLLYRVQVLMLGRKLSLDDIYRYL